MNHLSTAPHTLYFKLTFKNLNYMGFTHMTNGACFDKNKTEDQKGESVGKST